MIAATGNYGFFNVLSAALLVWLLDDDALAKIARVRRREPGRRPSLAARITTAALGLYFPPVALAETRTERREPARPLLRGSREANS